MEGFFFLLKLTQWLKNLAKITQLEKLICENSRVTDLTCVTLKLHGRGIFLAFQLTIGHTCETNVLCYFYGEVFSNSILINSFLTVLSFFFLKKKTGEVLQKWSFFLLKLTQWLKNLGKIAQLETYKIATHKWYMRM